jgi:YVTN family beta-propeller protein
VAFLPNGTRAYVTNENDGFVTLVDSVKHESMRTIKLGEPGVVKPMHVVLSSDGSKAYVSSGRGKKVFTIDTSTNEVIGSVEVGKRPWGIALSPDGKMLFAADGPSNSIAVVDLATGTVVKQVKVGEGPWGVLTLAR